MANEDVGSALTGQETDPATASNQWDSWLQRPGNRTALLQMGVNLMQPQGFGQTTAGAIGQAIGAGGEAVGRSEDIDLKSQLADAKMRQADEKLQILQQNAESNAVRASAAETSAAARLNAKKTGGLTDAIRAKFARDDQKAYEKSLNDDAFDLQKQANDILADPSSDVVKKYKGKSSLQIREELRKERPKPKFGAIPTNEDTPIPDETDPNAPDTPAVDAPPVAGARKATDGNWYVEDKERGINKKTGKPFMLKYVR